MTTGGKSTGISACALGQGLVVGRDRAPLGREPAGLIPEQSERRGEKTLREIKGIDPSSLGSGAAIGAEAMGGTVELRFCRPQEGKEGGDWKERLKHHPRPRRFQLRPPRHPRAITPGAPHSTATALSPEQCDVPRLRGGGVSDPSFSSPPCAAQLSPIRPGPAQPASTHGSDSSGGSSPAPASPPPTPRRSNAAGSETRGAWRVRTRGAFAPGTGSCSSLCPLAAPEPF